MRAALERRLEWQSFPTSIGNDEGAVLRGRAFSFGRIVRLPRADVEGTSPALRQLMGCRPGPPFNMRQDNP
jgi:hypothetical protein